jgi:hypothetical protein
MIQARSVTDDTAARNALVAEATALISNLLAVREYIMAGALMKLVAHISGATPEQFASVANRLTVLLSIAAYFGARKG